MQYQSGYLLQSVREALLKHAKAQDLTYNNKQASLELTGLLRWLSTFEVETSLKLKKDGRKQSIYAVATNILTRGLPTLPSIFIEEEFARLLMLTIRKNDLQRGKIDFVFTNEDSKHGDLNQLLHIVDSRLRDRKQYVNVDNLDSNFERSFLLNLIPESHSYLAQLFERQRPRSSFSRDNNQGRVDFSLEIPYDVAVKKSNRYHKEVNIKHHKTYIVEVDGARYHCDLLDDLKDFELGQFAKNVSHIKEATVYSDAAEVIRIVTDEEFVKRTAANYRNHNYSTDPTTTLTLAPFGIARIQRVLLEYLMANEPKTKLKVAVVEQDVPCGRLAIEDLTDLLGTLNDLASSPIDIPEFEYEVFSSDEFIDHPLHRGARPNNLSEIHNAQFDIIIDVSVLRRQGIFSQDKLTNAPSNLITIRSSHYLHYKTSTPVISAPTIEYRNLVTPLPNEVFEPEERICHELRKILQNVFRKLDFREGQLPILNRALKQKSVIGLLPTGGGKSLTYQLAAMLQPGMTIVIDPIRSLMKDQFEGLREIGIDKCEFINSTLTSGERRYNQNVLLANGQLQFIFVSPERFVIEEFRHALDNAITAGHYFSYAVIDEVHCVSEWGHDFRTPYLNLGQNAQQFCLTFSGNPVPLFGLTATASFDVLADIERELAIQNDDGQAIIRFENTVRDEINYAIKEVPVSVDGLEQVTAHSIRERVGAAKQQILFELIRTKDNLFNTFNDRRMLEQIIAHSFEEYLPLTIRQQKVNASGNEEIARNAYISSMLKRLKIEHPFLIKSADGATKYDYGMIVFTPHRKGWLGIKSGTESHGVFDKPGIVSTSTGTNRREHAFENERLGYFMGSGDDDDADITDEESFHHLDEFKECRSSLMVATKAFGMGIDKPNVRLTVHMNIPQSIESFVQEAGRGGRDGKVCTSIILYNNDHFDLDQQRTESYHLDKDVLLYFHKNSFKGQMKERVVIFELRNKITFPNAKNIQLLNDELNDLYGTEKIEFEIKLGRNKYANRVFINTLNGTSIGYVYMDSGTTGIYSDLGDDALCYEVVDWLKQKLPLTEIRNTGQLTAWLQQTVITQKEEVGIEKMLKDMSVGESNILVIPFTNRAYSKKAKNRKEFILNPVHQAFVQNIHAIRHLIEAGELDQTLLGKVLTDSVFHGYDYEQFVESLRIKDETVKKELQNLNHPHAQQLQRAYYAPRGQDDTAKAIYRLISIGIIDSYTIDYHHKIYRVSFTKKSDDDYFQLLEQLIARYTSKKNAERDVGRLRETFEVEFSEGKGSVISKCTEYLTNFIYGKIKEKRVQAINDMVRLCETAISKDSPIDQNIYIKDEIYYYFNAKYTRKPFIEKTSNGDIEASMPDDLDNDLGIWETIEKYIKLVENPETGEFISNTKHLRGSSMRMLRSNPEQPAYYMLKSFSLFIMADSIKSLLNDAKDEFVKGLIKWKFNDTDLDIPNFINFFKKKLADHITVSENHFIDIEDRFYSAYYHQWASDFRKRMNLTE